jgi:Leucine-rich repeat (LRR) protein
MFTLLKKYTINKNIYDEENKKKKIMYYFNKFIDLNIITNICVTNIDLQNLKELVNFKNLIYLNLSNNNIKKIETLPTKLVYLNLKNNKIKTICNLNTITNLEKIDLSYNNIKYIKNIILEKVIYINLSNNNLNYNTLKNLNLTNLKYIDISYNKIKFNHDIKKIFPNVLHICLKYNY